MSLKIVHEGVTKNPSSVPMSAFSLNPETQSFIEGGGGGRGEWVHVVLFFYLHNSRESIVLATFKFKVKSCRCSDTEMRAALKATEIILI